MFEIGGARETQGEWFTYHLKGKLLEECPGLKIRAIPSGKQKELFYKHRGRKERIRQRTLKEGGKRVRVTEMEVDNEATQALIIDGACFALTEVRRFPVQVGSEELAQQVGRALGRTVTPGEPLELDGPLPDDFKRLLFEHRTDLLEFVSEKVEKLSTVELEEERAAGET